MEITQIDQIDPKVEYKMILWLGHRVDSPNLSSKIHANSEITIQKEVQSAKCFPALIKWTDNSGKENFAKIDRPAKATDNR